MNDLKINIEYFIDSIVVRFDNRRLVLYPHEHGIAIIFKRLLDAEERAKLQENPEYLVKTAETININNRVVTTNINLNYDTVYILADVLYNQQRQIRTRQILNTIIKDASKSEAMQILNEANEEEFMIASQMFEDKQYDTIHLYLDTIKRRLCIDGIMEQKDSDNFDKPINQS